MKKRKIRHQMKLWRYGIRSIQGHEVKSWDFVTLEKKYYFIILTDLKFKGWIFKNDNDI